MTPIKARPPIVADHGAMVLKSYELYASGREDGRFLRLITCASDEEAFRLAGELAAARAGPVEVRRGGESLFTVADGPVRPRT